MEQDKYIHDLEYSEKHTQVPMAKLDDGSYGIELYEIPSEELPEVSVVTITYNRDYIFDIPIRNWSKFIYPKNKLEWIILDDSKLPTLRKKIPKDDRIKYVYLPDKIQTVSKKRNVAVEYATKKIICFMDDDDYYYPDSILNRVKVLLQYKKQVVGSVKLNCINLIDHTSYLTGGGIVKFKNGDKSLICSEASLCFYKSFWNKQKFNNEIKYEEIVDFLRNRQDDFIDLSGSFVMIAITHGKNMSHRVLDNSINIHDFLGTLDVNTVKFLEKIQQVIFMQYPENVKSLEVYKKIKNEGSVSIIKKINNLPIEIQRTPLMIEVRKQNPIIKKPPSNLINIIYFTGLFNKMIRVVDFDRLDEHEIQMYKLAEKLTGMKYKVNLYLNTDKETRSNGFNILPWWKFNNKDACKLTFVYREFSHLEDLNSQKIIYISTEVTKTDKNIFDKCTEVWLPSLPYIYHFNEATKYPIEKIHVYPFFLLNKGEYKPPIINNNYLTAYQYVNYDQIKYLLEKYDKIYLNRYERGYRNYKFDKVELVDNPRDTDASCIFVQDLTKPLLLELITTRKEIITKSLIECYDVLFNNISNNTNGEINYLLDRILI